MFYTKTANVEIKILDWITQLQSNSVEVAIPIKDLNVATNIVNLKSSTGLLNCSPIPQTWQFKSRILFLSQRYR